MRQFLAVEIGPELREEIRRLQGDLASRCAGWRWVPPENVHLTLRFLGAVDPVLDEQARREWAAHAAAAGCFVLRPGTLGRFPPRGQARVLWLDVHEEPEGGLAALAAELERAARALGFPPESKPFRPHLTLARAARGRRAVEPRETALVAAAPSTVERLVLFRSDLDPAGARYTALEHYPLAGRASGPSGDGARG